ncbi:MAG TPA: GNAT family protein [Terracidiphilus sp.]|jgi:RimJ/RimL family protein N-acetyltransferase|nr:GNAT family protein [Terracidiphilus sp.]
MRREEFIPLLATVSNATPVLQGKHVRLESLELSHAEALVAAVNSALDPSLYRWTQVPRTYAEALHYIEAALALRDAGTAFPFVTLRNDDGTLIGSTRFFDMQTWSWPVSSPRHGRTAPDVCEIGYTWLAQSAIRTAANTESKFLMLCHAFETWGVLRVCLHTDVRNLRSQVAIARIGGVKEGVLRAHRMAADGVARDSARFSIIATEWPGVKERLRRRMMQP